MSARAGFLRREREHGRNREGYERSRRRYVRPYSRRRRNGESGGRSAEGSGALNMFARLGFVARGIAYIVIGAIAVMLALGFARHEPDRAGALEAIADKPFGYLLLWILVIGFFALALWRFVQAAEKRLNPTTGHRVRALLSGIAYAIAFYSMLMFVVDGTKAKGVDGVLRSFAQTPFGPWLLILVALGLIAFGIFSFLEAKWHRTLGGVPV